MNEIIVVTKQPIGSDVIQTVNGRDLHAYLNVGKDFPTWIKDRIEKYDFIDGIDYISTSHKVGERKNVVKKEYHISLDMAKELSMTENNAQGKLARKYFIECEKRLNDTPKGIVLDNPMQLRAALLSYTEQVIELQQEVAQLAVSVAEKIEVIEEQAPAVDFVNNFVARGLNCCLRDAWKGLGLNPTKFSAKLVEDGILFRSGGAKIIHAKQQFINPGYFVERFNEYGTQTLVSPKGVVWITKHYKDYLLQNSK